MASHPQNGSTNSADVTTREVLQKVHELLTSGEAARRLEAGRPAFDKAVAKLKRAEAIDLEKLRRTVTI